MPVWQGVRSCIQTSSAPPGKAISICHVAVGDLWAGAEVQLKVLLSKLVAEAEIESVGDSVQ